MGLINKIRQFGELVMFSHTLFSLPFAAVSMIWAAEGFPSARLVFWILIALFAGRNAANAINRVIDADYDKENPRTAGRQIPQGKVKKSEAIILTTVLLAIFVFAAYQLNFLCFVLSPLAIALFLLYSYTKRWTWACHLVLGAICAGAPVGAWIAVTGKLALPPLVLAAGVTFWIAGFDTLYGTQDIDFDKSVGLHSIPERFGLKNALIIAKIFHVFAWGFFFLAGAIGGIGWLYLVGMVVIAFLLSIEHHIVQPANHGIMNWASYHINQIVSILYLTMALLDAWIIGRIG
ncbi:putative 4-hydroxybenzoate polyprenyltransferase [Gottschalkiaceae bacterium SANA]|nr:putative 4-hydroxybenzoate polyprenyltransferase [Gottschalkiaceae bacterium SANA]